MKALIKLGIVVLIGWFAWNYFFPEGTGERAPIMIVNGPVRVEAMLERRGRGEFKKGLWGYGRSWYHYHPGHRPSTLEVIVTDSSCGPEAKYTTTEMRILSTGGASSTITVKVGGIGPLGFLEVDPDSGTVVRPDPRQPYRLDIGGADDQLSYVRLEGSTCSFVPGQGSITVYQRQ